MRKIIICISLIISLLSPFVGLTQPEDFTSKVNGMTLKEGFFDFYWEEKTGKIWLVIDRLDTEFLYVNSLVTGVGSNDIGLDRGQLGDNRVVKFVRSGNKVLLLQPNYGYRAVSDNPDEVRSVREAFAESVLWGFVVSAEEGSRLLVDATDFLLQDAHDVVGALQRTGQGSYGLDKSRSMIFLENTKNFPKNSELEVMLTFVGKPQGGYISAVTPTPTAVTVRQRHSFIELPDAGFQPRTYDPRSGFFAISYQDYATPIGEPLVKRFIVRHRLEKKDPNAVVSEPVEPLIYYVDRGAPEPIRSALIDGASWWNEAFEAAGFRNAFRVEVLPEGADPMDVRYNVIQWVHRATRGWSYGGSVIDPRTGEILKGHVSLGSLRVRQDYLIAQGLLSPFKEGVSEAEASKPLEAVALARLRQLSAHEVGHTLGLAHNFAASTKNRASVMDYPHPHVLWKNAKLDFSEVYDTGIGEWDKRAIVYGYSVVEGDEKEALNRILQQTIEQGLPYLSDEAARPASSPHPAAHLWDNGEDVASGLFDVINVRSVALFGLGLNSLPKGTPMAELENILVPIYLYHRYQMEATAKLIGGVSYTYALKGDGQLVTQVVPQTEQRRAVFAILKTLESDFLTISPKLLALIPPQPAGYERGRENFKSRTGLTFDPLAAAESAANMSLSLLLNTERANRLFLQGIADEANYDLDNLNEDLFQELFKRRTIFKETSEIKNVVRRLTIRHLCHLAVDENAHSGVAATANRQLRILRNWLYNTSDKQIENKWELIGEIEQFFQHPERFKPTPIKPLPDGSPIGCGG